MTKASDNAYPSVLVAEGTEPSAPAAGHQRIYIDSTSHHLSRTDSSGTQVDLETNQAAGGVATDPIWDAAGDLAQGTGANTGARLAIGTAGQVLTVNAGATAAEWAAASGAQVYPYHASMPGSLYPVTTVNMVPTSFGGGIIALNNGAGALNDEAVYRILLAAGTYRLDVVHYVRTGRGIGTFALDTDGASYTDIGTIDSYAASPSTGVGTMTFSAITAITVATDGLWFFRVKIASKNGSSAGYTYGIQEMSFTRTGA